MIGGFDKNGRPKDGRGVSYTNEGGAPLGYFHDDSTTPDFFSGFLGKLALIAAVFYGWNAIPSELKYLLVLGLILMFRGVIWWVLKKGRVSLVHLIKWINRG